MTRSKAIAAVFDRARTLGKKVYGYASARPSCEEVRQKSVPAAFDRLCVEGD